VQHREPDHKLFRVMTTISRKTGDKPIAHFPVL
jgi:hypothetical protein